MMSIAFASKKETQEIKVNKSQGEWLLAMLPQLSVAHTKTYTLQEVKDSYEAAGLEDFELFWDNKPLTNLHKFGLLQL